MMMSNGGGDDQDNVVENGALEQNSYGFSYGPFPPPLLQPVLAVCRLKVHSVSRLVLMAKMVMWL